MCTSPRRHCLETVLSTDTRWVWRFEYTFWSTLAFFLSGFLSYHFIFFSLRCTRVSNFNKPTSKLFIGLLIVGDSSCHPAFRGPAFGSDSLFATSCRLEFNCVSRFVSYGRSAFACSLLCADPCSSHTRQSRLPVRSRAQVLSHTIIKLSHVLFATHP